MEYCKVVIVSAFIFHVIFVDTTRAENKTELTGLKCNNADGCSSEVEECNEVCGCDGQYKQDDTGECILDLDYLRAANVDYGEAENKTELSGLKCNNTEGCSSDVEECNEVCGCDRLYKQDDTGECILDLDYLRERTRSVNVDYGGENVDPEEEEGMTKMVRERNDRIFRGIMFCGIFFVTCASACVLSVCIFCCKIHYSDHKLKSEVKALASKINMDYRKKQSMKKKIRDPKEEACNVIVEDANVLCV